MQLSSRQNFVLKKKKDLHRLAEALQITGTLKCYQGSVFLVWYWNNSRERLACNNNNNGNNFISVFPRRISTWYYLLFYIIFIEKKHTIEISEFIFFVWILLFGSWENFVPRTSSLTVGCLPSWILTLWHENIETFKDVSLDNRAWKSSLKCASKKTRTI